MNPLDFVAELVGKAPQPMSVQSLFPAVAAQYPNMTRYGLYLILRQLEHDRLIWDVSVSGNRQTIWATGSDIGGPT